MAGRFSNPFPQFNDSTPTMYSGGKLWFYAAGTSTPQNTYSDASLSSANTNPVVLNSAGRPAVDIYLQDLSYKVVLQDANSNTIWTADNYTARDSKLIAKTLTGSGSPTGVVAGTQGSASILPDFYWDYTNAILYVCTATGTASTTVWTAVNASTAAAVVPPPQGRLTLTSGLPVLAADVTAATAVYYTPYVGNIVPIYNGSAFIPTVFTEQTLSLVASHAASNIYDVFIFSNSGVVTVVTGPSWSAGTAGSITAGSCARGTGAGGTALARISGTLTNAVQITGRNGSTTYTIGANLATYVGSLFMDGTNGQISCHSAYGQSRKWGVWNAYNRMPILLKAGDSTSSWNYSTVTVRPANNSTANKLTIFSGLAEELYQLRYSVFGNSDSSAIPFTGIGYNSTTTTSGFRGIGSLSTKANLEAEYDAAPALGINDITALESSGSGATTFSGTESSLVLIGSWRG